MEIEFTDQNFEEYASQSKPIVIDFFATWCGPCRQLAPTIEDFANRYEGKVLVGKCNVDENDGLVGRFGIRNIPAVFFLKGSEIIDKSIGAVPAAQLEEKLKAIL